MGVLDIVQGLIPRNPMIPGVFNDGDVEEAKRKLREQAQRDLLKRVIGNPVPLDSSLPVLTRQPSVNPTVPITRAVMPDAAPVTEMTPYTPTPSLEDLGAPPIMIRRNNKNRPLEAIGGGDALERDQALLESQQNYKAPFSKKDFALKSLFSFLQGGLPGLALGAVDYAANQDTRNRMAVGSDITKTQGQIKDQLMVRNSVSDLLNEQSQRDLRAAQAESLITRANKEPPHFIERPDGVYKVDADNPDGQKIANIPAEAKRSVVTQYFERPDGVYGVNDQHPEGFKVGGVPAKPELTPYQRESLSRRDRDFQARQAKGVKVSESQVREAAKAKGLDPNKAVERARQRGLL